MNTDDRDIEGLLRCNAERQLRDFDWDGLHAGISDRLDRARSPAAVRRGAWFFRIAPAAVAAAALVLLTIPLYWRAAPDSGPSLLEQIAAGRVDAGPLGPVVSRANNLIADTSPRTILLTDQMHLVCSDPLLRPHSVWEQEPMPASANAHIKEKRR